MTNAATLAPKFARLARESVRAAWIAGLRPEPRVTVSEWADANRILSRRSSAEDGPWRTSRTPYLREIMDCLSESSRVTRVVFMKGAQVGGTEVGNNWLGYVIDHSPATFMLVMPSGPTLKRKSRQVIDALIEDTPTLRRKVATRKGREPGNTTLMKVFPGGMLALASAESPADLRSMTARFLFIDELDGYPMDLNGEGDPDELAERATRTYQYSKKIFKVSTPTTRARSRIARQFARTDRRYYEVPCPHCKGMQRIEWRRKDGRFGISWDGRDDDETAKLDREQLIADIEEGKRKVWLECEHCDERIDEHYKTWMLAEENGARWVPEDPSRGEFTRGYHLSALYSPFGMYAWSDSVVKFLKAKGNPKLLQVWANHDLGEEWQDEGEAPAWERLYRQREEYDLDVVPRGAFLLTCGVDVQIDRCELEVVAWGEDLVSWSISYQTHVGKPTYPAGEFWPELDRLLMKKWPRADGGPPLSIASMAIDSGSFTQDVYRWVRKYGLTRRLSAIKGRTGIGSFIGVPKLVDVRIQGQKIRNGCRLWPVDSGLGKEDLYSRLAQEPPLEDGDPFPPGYCHFPQYGPEFFKGLTSEVLVRRRTKAGNEVYDWEVLPGRRNEPLDVRVYAMAAASILGIERWGSDDWKAVRGELPAEPEQTTRRDSPWRRSRKRT